MANIKANKSVCAAYGRRKRQVHKSDLYMLTALWMQESPWAMEEIKEGEQVVGSVFVLPNDRVLSVDCTRSQEHTTVHGAIRPLIKYPDKVKDCEVYLSRKPCAHCVKMLVQAGVSKVFYLPLKPEKPADKEGNNSVDALFRVSEVSREFYVPRITQEHIKDLVEEKKPYEKEQDDEVREKWKAKGESSLVKNREKQEWDETWIKEIKEELDWQEIGDKEIETQVRQDMENAFKWFCLATFATGTTREMKWEKYQMKNTDPTESGEKLFNQNVAAHLSRLAQMLSNRTDDPNRAVGSVITVGDEIVSIGWNGFPSKALYGNHPRGSESDPEAHQKYPHVIHAKQNALLCRNQRNLEEECTVYVNKIPCNDCVSMLYEVGARKVVLPYFEDKGKKSENIFFNLLGKSQIEAYRQCNDLI